MKITRTSIKAASDSDNEDYVEELAKQAAELASTDSGWNITYNIAGDMICFTISDGTQQVGTYIQPVEDIYADWSELEDDAQQLSSDILLSVDDKSSVDIDLDVGSPTL